MKHTEIFTVEREELKRDWKFLIELIQREHKMGPEVYQELYVDHTPVQDLCHTRTCYMIIDFGDSKYFIEYEMDHIIQDVELQVIGRRLASVTFFPDFQTYEANRFKSMNAQPPNKQTGINYN
jgi:hypothetical protein